MVVALNPSVPLTGANIRPNFSALMNNVFLNDNFPSHYLNVLPLFAGAHNTPHQRQIAFYAHNLSDCMRLLALLLKVCFKQLLPFTNEIFVYLACKATNKIIAFFT